MDSFIGDDKGARLTDYLALMKQGVADEREYQEERYRNPSLFEGCKRNSAKEQHDTKKYEAVGIKTLHEKEAAGKNHVQKNLNPGGQQIT
jgi:hypothetical protein